MRSDEQIDFTTVYAIGRQGIAKMKLTDESKDLTPLLETILKQHYIETIEACTLTMLATNQY